jgi:hypothetical protein
MAIATALMLIVHVGSHQVQRHRRDGLIVVNGRQWQEAGDLDRIFGQASLSVSPRA